MWYRRRRQDPLALFALAAALIGLGLVIQAVTALLTLLVIAAVAGAVFWVIGPPLRVLGLRLAQRIGARRRPVGPAVILTAVRAIRRR